MESQQTTEDVLLEALCEIIQRKKTPMARPAESIAGEAIQHYLAMKKQTTIVNIREGEEYDVYIGRPSKWGNPFRLADYGNDRELIIQVYRQWLQRPAQKALRIAARKELMGKRLGCYCAPMRCHGHVLRDIMAQQEET